MSMVSRCVAGWGSSCDEPGLVVDLVAETGGVDNGEGDAGALLVKLELCRPLAP